MEKKRKHIVAGNWKMNTNYEQGRELAKAIMDKLAPSDVRVILGAPFTHLKVIHSVIVDVNNLFLAAQNCHQAESGAYTGEISAGMLKAVGVKCVILGHSERREYFQESDALIAQKIDQVLHHDMLPIFCCGEKLEVRESGGHLDLVASQVSNALFHLTPEDFEKVVVAYEPVWAIGTGKVASPEQAQEMHAHIRKTIAGHFGAELADKTSILYGGSVKGSNAKELFAKPDVDGGLIGGAALNAEEFVQIVNSF
ncbi:MAG: triose-phosphate isomerase [Saprospirales bacterium]|nr:triose-phosphate isomerase [Saprospirales bacterium]